MHQNLTEQTKLFNSDLYECLSYLNPTSNQQEANTEDSNTDLNSYKACKWNSNKNINLIYVLSNFSSISIFVNSKIRLTLPSRKYEESKLLINSGDLLDVIIIIIL